MVPDCRYAHTHLRESEKETKRERDRQTDKKTERGREGETDKKGAREGDLAWRKVWNSYHKS